MVKAGGAAAAGVELPEDIRAGRHGDAPRSLWQKKRDKNGGERREEKRSEAAKLRKVERAEGRATRKPPPAFARPFCGFSGHPSAHPARYFFLLPVGKCSTHSCQKNSKQIVY